MVRPLAGQTHAQSSGYLLAPPMDLADENDVSLLSFHINFVCESIVEHGVTISAPSGKERSGGGDCHHSTYVGAPTVLPRIHCGKVIQSTDVWNWFLTIWSRRWLWGSDVSKWATAHLSG